MLPQFDVFEPKVVQAASSVAPDFSSLLPSLSSLRSQVAKAAQQQRQADQASLNKWPGAMSRAVDVWGDPRNGRSFNVQGDGSASYEFRTGETLRAVVIDLLSECKKTDSSIATDYPSIRAASNQILSFNGIADADLINAGAKIVIPQSLVPSRKLSA